MKLVLTNDDGIDAPGFLALEQACRGWAEAVAVAPDGCHSSMSHRVNTDRVIAVEELPQRGFSVHASPADCARLAKACLTPDAAWLVSGINRGANLGMDVCYSGTVAAAREAALLGWPAIAISQYVKRGVELDWQAIAARAGAVLRQLTRERLAPGEFWNVNLPHLLPGETAVAEISMCELDPCPLPVAFKRESGGYRYQGDYPARARTRGHDVELCFAGAITATRCSIRRGF